ncbi:unnamed protein product [Arctia plantaginis]|uniref:Uncharacterized protein n=1 Tax=Arctia plantaginis TaxID=874455 RepID=A0A8S0Z1G0_ARCPL|nr:unnamed protein product [Arctia plantaginis]
MDDFCLLSCLNKDLHIHIREKIPRDDVNTFDELLKVARGVERTLPEKKVFGYTRDKQPVRRKKKILLTYIQGMEVKARTCHHMTMPLTSTPKFSCYGLEHRASSGVTARLTTSLNCLAEHQPISDSALFNLILS